VAGVRTLTPYSNGTAGTAGTNANAAIANTGALSIGSTTTPGNYASMTIADLCIWDRVLSAAQVSELYNAGLRRDPRTITGGGPIALYAFQSSDNMTGGTGSVEDLIGGRNLTPTNTESGDLVDGPP